MTLRQFLISLALFASLLLSTAWHHLPIGERDVPLDIGTLWQSSSVYGDAGMYLAQVEDFGLSTAPYRYRVLPTLAVRAIDSVLGMPPIVGYILFNALCFLIVGVGFTAYLMRWYALPYPTALLGGVLAVTTVQMQSMLLLPMLEPASYVAALAVFWALHTRRPLVFAITAALAILTKEVFIVLIPIYLVLAWSRHPDPSGVLRTRETGLR